MCQDATKPECKPCSRTTPDPKVVDCTAPNHTGFLRSTDPTDSQRYGSCSPSVSLWRTSGPGGLGRDPLDALTDGRLGGGGTAAVAGFFGLSGYLLALSRSRNAAAHFLLRRGLRIVPGYIIAVVLTALIVGCPGMSGSPGYLPPGSEASAGSDSRPIRPRSSTLRSGRCGRSAAATSYSP